MRAYIYGLGKGKQILDRCLIKENLSIIAYIDNYKVKETNSCGGIPVISEDEIISEYDAIIITLMKYEDTKKRLQNLGIANEKIICFYSFSSAECPDNWKFIDAFKWRFELMCKNYKEVVMPSIVNFPYEIYADKLADKKKLPKIISVDETAEIIWKERKCLARLGDGEFELILGRKRAKFQKVTEELGIRLKNVLESSLDNLLVGIADNYSSLEKYTDEAALAIRRYLGTGATRQEHMQLLDMEKTYYDAYLSRPYMIYRNKKNAEVRFGNIRRIWTDQDVLVVEGEHTRFGVGNDLLDNTKSVQRILTKDSDCFEIYDSLLQQVREYGRDKLVLIILGPVATVMAYDLARENFWAVDIGQLDVEYEWYLRKVTERCNIPYKTVSEISQYAPIETNENENYIKKYKCEIIKVVTR